MGLSQSSEGEGLTYPLCWGQTPVCCPTLDCRRRCGSCIHWAPARQGEGPRSEHRPFLVVSLCPVPMSKSSHCGVGGWHVSCSPPAQGTPSLRIFTISNFHAPAWPQEPLLPGLSCPPSWVVILSWQDTQDKGVPGFPDPWIRVEDKGEGSRCRLAGALGETLGRCSLCSATYTGWCGVGATKRHLATFRPHPQALGLILTPTQADSGLALGSLLRSSATPLHICFSPLPLAWPERTKGHRRSTGQPSSDKGGGPVAPVRSHLPSTPTL